MVTRHWSIGSLQVHWDAPLFAHQNRPNGTGATEPGTAVGPKLGASLKLSVGCHKNGGGGVQISLWASDGISVCCLQAKGRTPLDALKINQP